VEKEVIKILLYFFCILICMMELNSNNFQEFLRGNKIAVIDFWAPWCSPCRALEPILKEVEKEMGNVSFGKVNVDENMELAQYYGIRSIPTLIIFVNGKERDRIIGYVAKEDIVERIREAL